MKYDLMHKNIPVLSCEIDHGRILKVDELYHPEHAPVGTQMKDHVDRPKLARWFKGRAIPASRDGIKRILDALAVDTTAELMERSLALSLSDQYWIRPDGEHIRWEDVNYFQNGFSEDMGALLFNDRLIRGSAELDMASPDASLDGWLKKKWKIIDGERYLFKSGSSPYHQEPLNERIASELCALLNIEHIDYRLEYSKQGRPYSICRDHITQDTELVTAVAVSTLSKQPGSESDHAHYIRVCREQGIEDISHALDEMLCIDHLMANIDRHWNNFGLIRDADTLEPLGPFPIFDTGTSLWNDTQEMLIPGTTVYSRTFRGTLEDQLRYVQDASFLDLSALRCFPDIIHDVLSSSMYMSESRVSVICSEAAQRVGVLEKRLARTLVSGISLCDDELSL